MACTLYIHTHGQTVQGTAYSAGKMKDTLPLERHYKHVCMYLDVCRKKTGRVFIWGMQLINSAGTYPRRVATFVPTEAAPPVSLLGTSLIFCRRTNHFSHLPWCRCTFYIFNGKRDRMKLPASCVFSYFITC